MDRIVLWITEQWEFHPKRSVIVVVVVAFAIVAGADFLAS